MGGEGGKQIHWFSSLPCSDFLLQNKCNSVHPVPYDFILSFKLGLLQEHQQQATVGFMCCLFCILFTVPLFKYCWCYSLWICWNMELACKEITVTFWFVVLWLTALYVWLPPASNCATAEGQMMPSIQTCTHPFSPYILINCKISQSRTLLSQRYLFGKGSLLK